VIQDQALAEITRHMIDFIGTHTRDELCREGLLRASTKKASLFFRMKSAAPVNSTVQIDVAGINTMEKTLILGECKWTTSPVDQDMLMKLVEEKVGKIIPTEIVPSEGKWRVYILGFSRSGWTEEAIQYQKELQKRKYKGENWQAVGMRLVDLNQLDQDLEQWSEPTSSIPEEITF